MGALESDFGFGYPQFSKRRVRKEWLDYCGAASLDEPCGVTGDGMDLYYFVKRAGYVDFGKWDTGWINPATTHREVADDVFTMLDRIRKMIEYIKAAPADRALLQFADWHGLTHLRLLYMGLPANKYKHERPPGGWTAELLDECLRRERAAHRRTRPRVPAAVADNFETFHDVGICWYTRELQAGRMTSAEEDALLDRRQAQVDAVAGFDDLVRLIEELREFARQAHA